MNKNFFELFDPTLPFTAIDDAGIMYCGMMVAHCVESWVIGQFPNKPTLPEELRGVPCGILRSTSGITYMTLELPPMELVGKGYLPPPAKKRKPKK